MERRTAQFGLNRDVWRDDYEPFPESDASFTAGELLFTNAGGSFGFTSSAVGNVLTLNGVGNVGINNNGAGLETFANAIKLGAAQTWTTTSTGTLTFNAYSTATVNLSGFQLTANAGAGLITFNEAISGTGAGSLFMTSGTGTVALNGANTYAGATSVTAGILQLGNISAINGSSGVTVASNAELQFNLTGTNTFNGPAMTISGTGVGSAGAIDNIASGVNTYNGNLTLGAATTIQDNGTLTLGGTIGNGGFALTVNGSGAPNLNGAISGGGALIYSGTGRSTSAVPTPTRGRPRSVRESWR